VRIGLALSGGAARGIAHIGVLKYLEERNVKPYCLAGTSAGSIVGAFYCSGMSVEEIKDIALTMTWRNIFKPTLPRMGLINSSQLLSIIQEHLGPVSFRELKIPLIVNAVDLLSGEQVIIDKGPVADAVHASCAIPGIFTPVKWNDQLLVDGGLLDNLPTALIKDRWSIDYIIGVNVAAQRPLDQEPANIFEVLIQSFDIIRRHRDLQSQEFADMLIEPNVADVAFFDTSKADQLLERGYQTAQKVLEGVNFEKKAGVLAKWFGKHDKSKRKW